MADYETLHVCRVGYHDANNVSNFGGDPVTQLNFKTFLFILFMKLGSLLSARCRHRSMSSSMEGHTSLRTALVYHGYMTYNSYQVLKSKIMPNKFDGFFSRENN